MRCEMNSVKKKKSVFGSVVCIIFCLVFIGIAFTWNYLWLFLDAYEKTDSKYVTNEVMKPFLNNDISKILEMSGVQSDELNTHDDYIKYFKEHYCESLTVAQLVPAEKTAEIQKYKIACDGKALFDVTLTRSGNADKYGFRGWSVKTDSNLTFEKKHSVKAYVPQGAEVLANGVKIGENYLVKEEYSVPGYGGLPEGLSTPVFNVYMVDGFLNKPTVDILMNGEKADFSETEKGTYYALQSPSEALKNTASQLVAADAVLYVKFITTDATFTELAERLVSNTDFYKAVRGFSNEWYIDHTFSSDNPEISELEVYDDNHFSALTEFTYYVKPLKGWHLTDYKVKYKIYYINTAEGWKISCIEFL